MTRDADVGVRLGDEVTAGMASTPDRAAYQDRLVEPGSSIGGPIYSLTAGELAQLNVLQAEMLNRFTAMGTVRRGCDG